ncbi:MAG: T9SS type A sorting domain-containing protein [Rufibacter sp.]
MSPTYKNLNQYFEAARAQEPVLPLEELTQQLARHSASGGTAGKASAVAGKKPLLWTLGSAGSVAAVVVLWLYSTQSIEKPSPAATVVAEAPSASTSVQEPRPAAARVPVPAAAHEKLIVGSGKPPVLKEKEQEIVWNPSSKEGRPAFENPNSLYHNKLLVAVPMKAKPAEEQPKEGEKVFGNITLLELPREVEQKLGIEMGEQGILYERLSRDSVEGLVRLRISIFEDRWSVYIGEPTRTFKGREVLTDSSKLLIPHSSFFPLFVTERNGTLSMLYRTDGEDKRKTDFKSGYFNEMLNSMIPVLVKANNQAKNEAIFWFAATPDFLKTLPPSIGQAISKEYKQVAEQKHLLADTLQSAGTAVKAATQLKYFESNPNSQSPIQYAVVFPNPVADALNVSMSLKREEEMRVSLVDISGRLVKVLSPYKRYQAGAITEKFHVKGESKGIYLLLTETKSGHRHTQRIIIE